MSFSRFRRSLSAALILLLCLCFLPPHLASAQDTPGQQSPEAASAKKPAEPNADAKPDSKSDTPPPLPPDATVPQTAAIKGRTLHYSATVGTIPVFDRTDPAKPEIKTGEVVVTSYLLDGVADKMNRPVTFALNGGPGEVPPKADPIARRVFPS